jgi:hypothetical protein
MRNRALATARQLLRKPYMRISENVCKAHVADSRMNKLSADVSEPSGWHHAGCHSVGESADWQTYSDGLVEAHDPHYEMFGFPRLGALIAEHGKERSLVDSLLEELYAFTGEGWEQEDDITPSLRYSALRLQQLPRTPSWRRRTSRTARKRPFEFAVSM